MFIVGNYIHDPLCRSGHRPKREARTSTSVNYVDRFSAGIACRRPSHPFFNAGNIAVKHVSVDMADALLSGIKKGTACSDPNAR